MSRLAAIKSTAQEIAEAISAAVGIEVEIVDEDLTIIAGTGRYKERIGLKEEEGRKDAGYIYGRVLQSGQEYIIEDTLNDLTYDPSVVEGKTEEIAEICSPIILEDNVIGVMGLVAFQEQQREALLSNKQQLLVFIRRMAYLLASKVSETEMANQLRTIVEAIDEGILAINSLGIVTHCNKTAEMLLKQPRNELINQHLSTIWPDSPMLEALRTGESYVDQEDIYLSNGKRMHFLVTAMPVKVGEEVVRVVASFKDIADVRRLVYNLAEKQQSYHFRDIKGNSKVLSELVEKALRIARGNATVLILGESGTGKDLFARAIHSASTRSKGPFITVNCGAIPETILESELFGYEGGAFTGARREGKPGKFELANNGTIFLDEIGDLPLHLQVKLLHVLQQKQIERVGGNKIIPVDIRIIAATNRDLEQMMREGEFRVDLYYRLSVIPLYIPPLRERKEDIPVLVQYFLDKYKQLLGKKITGFSQEVLDFFMQYDWPGNVREVENVVEYAVNMTTEPIITLESIPPRLKKSFAVSSQREQNSLKELLENYEQEIFQDYLNKYGDSLDAKHKIAQILGISTATLYRKLNKLGLLKNAN